MARPVDCLAGAGIFDLALAGAVERAGRDRLDIAGDALAHRRGDEIERGTGRPRTTIDDVDDTADAALALLLGQALNLGIDGRADLVVEQALSVPGDVTQHEGGEKREDDEIGRRQLEGGRAEQCRQELLALLRRGARLA